MIDAIDRVARTSADQLRAGTAGDADAGLADLHVRQARHRRRTGIAAAGAVVLAAGLGIGAGVGLTRTHVDRAPSPTSPVTSTDGFLGDPTCAAPRVECLGDRTYQFGLVRPVRWALPPGFGGNSAAGATPLLVEIYRSVGPTAGVTVLEHVRASSPRGTRAAPGVGDSPKAFVEWVSTRPFLEAGRVKATTLGGHAAWQVRVTLAPGVPQGPGACSEQGFRCYAIAHQPGGAYTGIWANMAAQYTAVHLPGGGTTVVWSWIFTGDPAHLGTLEEAVHGISWPTG